MDIPTEQATKNDNGCGRLMLLGCVAFICSCCCIFTSIFAFTGGITYLTMQNAPSIGKLSNQICDIKLGKLNEAYDQRFTSSFKQRTSFSEFRRLYTQNSDVFAACISDENFGVGDFLSRSVSFSYNKDEINLEFTSKGKRVNIVLIKTGSDWLIDQMSVV
jgi:hypothetical protein